VRGDLSVAAVTLQTFGYVALANPHHAAGIAFVPDNVNAEDVDPTEV
jgi:hypothetical protein